MDMLRHTWHTDQGLHTYLSERFPSWKEGGQSIEYVFLSRCACGNSSTGAHIRENNATVHYFASCDAIPCRIRAIGRARTFSRSTR